jgi:hypothetical protein
VSITADALDMLAGDPPRYPHVPGDFRRHPETGAPYVNHPTDTTKDGRPRRVMYGRPSSFGSALDNPFNLIRWKERKLIEGIARQEQAGGVDLLNLDDRGEVDGFIAYAYDVAETSLAADRGTHVHLLCEWCDRGRDWTELYEAGEALGIPEALQTQIVDQWRQFRFRLGLTALAVEQTVVNDRWRLAGTLDRLDVSDRDHLTAYGILEAGVPFVGDIKTGGLTVGNDGQPNYWVKYPVQLAAYVDAVPYDTETDERLPREHLDPRIALIYHYDLARALNGELVDWQAIPVNVQAGREGGDLCRAAADFRTRRDLFAMPAPTNVDLATGEPRRVVDQAGDGKTGCRREAGMALPDTSPADLAAPAGPNPTVEQRTADPEPSTASTAVPGRAAPWERERLRDRIQLLLADDMLDGRTREREDLLRRHWPEGVPTLKHDGHSDAQLQLILAAVRRVEAEIGAGWHPDDGPPHKVPAARSGDAEASAGGLPVDEGGMVDEGDVAALHQSHGALDYEQGALVAQIAKEARDAGRTLSVAIHPTLRRWSIARAVIAWAASGRSVDELWLAASNLATFEQCRDPSATLGGLISQFTIEQANRLWEAA